MFTTTKKYNELEKKFNELQAARVPQNHEERICELEMKLAKLYRMAIDVNQISGKEKLNKEGKKLFGGQSKHLQNP